MIVYIAGPMKGIENHNVPAFMKAHSALQKRGYIVLNPCMLPDNMPDDKYLPICMAMLQQADAVYMLRGWEKSLGATTEKLYAERQGIDIYYEEEV